MAKRTKTSATSGIDTATLTAAINALPKKARAAMVGALAGTGVDVRTPEQKTVDALASVAAEQIKLCNATLARKYGDKLNVQALALWVHSATPDGAALTLGSGNRRHANGTPDGRAKWGNALTAINVTAIRVGRTPLTSGETFVHSPEKNAVASDVLLAAAKVAGTFVNYSGKTIKATDKTVAGDVYTTDNAGRILLGQSGAPDGVGKLRGFVAVKIGQKWTPIASVKNA